MFTDAVADVGVDRCRSGGPDGRSSVVLFLFRTCCRRISNIFISGAASTDAAAICTSQTTRSSAIAMIADRTACSILTLFIVCTTSRPLNKKSVCCQSANPINNYCGSASANSQSAHLSARAVGTRHRPRRSHRTALCHS